MNKPPIEIHSKIKNIFQYYLFENLKTQTLQNLINKCKETLQEFKNQKMIVDYLIVDEKDNIKNNLKLKIGLKYKNSSNFTFYNIEAKRSLLNV